MMRAYITKLALYIINNDQLYSILFQVKIYSVSIVSVSIPKKRLSYSKSIEKIIGDDMYLEHFVCIRQK